MRKHLTHRLPLALLVASFGLALGAGCDVEPGSALDYDVVARVDLDAVHGSAWARGALDGGSIQVAADTAPSCSKLVQQADAITLGTGNHRLELYVEGKLDAAATKACTDELERGLAGKKTGKKQSQRLRVENLGDELLGLAIGPDPMPAPSKDRLQDLLDAHPSATGKEPIWFIVQQAPKDKDVKYVEGWADVRKGLDAHVNVEFKDDAAAKKAHAEASLGLTALRLSGELADLADGIKVAASGDSLTADIHATQAQMKKVVAAAKDAPKKPDEAPKSSGFSFRIETK